MEGVVLHEDGAFRLYHMGRDKSVLAHKCGSYPEPSKEKWWFLPHHSHKCFMCGAVPSDEIRGLYTLHNWDRRQAAK